MTWTNGSKYFKHSAMKWTTTTSNIQMQSNTELTQKHVYERIETRTSNRKQRTTISNRTSPETWTGINLDLTPFPHSKAKSRNQMKNGNVLVGRLELQMEIWNAKKLERQNRGWKVNVTLETQLYKTVLKLGQSYMKSNRKRCNAGTSPKSRTELNGHNEQIRWLRMCCNRTRSQ